MLESIRNSVMLKDYSYWNVGGVCDKFFIVETFKQLEWVILATKLDNTLVVGNGTNVLFDSKGFDGSIIKLGNEFSQIILNKNIVKIGAASWLPKVVRSLSRVGLGGLEHCIGIPATIGGLVAMNGGSQRKSISDCILSVEVMDKHGNILNIKKNDCEFGYRKSIFLNEKFVILSVELELEEITPNSNRGILLKILGERRRKFPRKEPNCGSVFKSSIELFDRYGPPGLIIEEIGLKGFSLGGAQVSELHANFIVNNKSATSEDIIALVKHINSVCKSKLGFKMESEVIYVSKNGSLTPVSEV